MKLFRFLPVLVVGLLVALWLGSPVTYLEIAAPDGTGERLEARHARYRSFIAVFPGQGGDHPGVLILRGPQGQVCGRMAVPIINLVSDVRWRSDEIRLPAINSIRRCVVRSGPERP